MDGQLTCKECGTVLSGDDVAIYLKLVSRYAKDYLCIDCLGKMLKCGREPIEERIRYYRASGNCVLFR
jgi:biotin operon repressor